MPPSSHNGPVILFDGVCNLCSDAVRFVIARDPEATFRFASLQSGAGRSLLDGAGLPPDELRTIVLIEDGLASTRSTAVLRILSRLRTPWRLLSIFRFTPLKLRDALYDLVARHRYRIFGRYDRCLVPTPELRSRILEGGYGPGGTGEGGPDT